MELAAVQPEVCGCDDPALDFGFLPACAPVPGEAELLDQGARLVMVKALVQAEVMGMAAHQLVVVATHPSITAPGGTPRPSVSTGRLTLRLPRSVALVRFFSPAQRRLAQAAVA
jgi:hypothetical protein